MGNPHQRALDNLTPPEDDEIEIDCEACNGSGFCKLTKEACRQCDGEGVNYVSERELKRKQKESQRLERLLAKEYEVEEDY